MPPSVPIGGRTASEKKRGTPKGTAARSGKTIWPCTTVSKRKGRGQNNGGGKEIVPRKGGGEGKGGFARVAGARQQCTDVPELRRENWEC